MCRCCQVYAAYAISPLFMVYFLLIIMFGFWFILALVIANFQEGFKQFSIRVKSREFCCQPLTTAIFVLQGVAATATEEEAL